MRLEGLKALPVLNSNGDYTIMVTLSTKKNKSRTIVPGGTSAGAHEKKTTSTNDAVARIKILNNKLKGQELTKIDELIETEAGNVSTGISIATQKLIAKEKGKQYYEQLGGNTLPIPFMNIINGGMHAGNELSFQEFMIAPIGKTFSESILMATEVYKSLKNELKNKYGKQATNVGMEGGFSPPMKKNTEALKTITNVLEKLGYREEVKLAIDAAANSFYNKNYQVDGLTLNKEKLINYYEKITKDYNLISIEDPFNEEDFMSFNELHERLKNTQIVGDDLTVTNPERVIKAVDNKSCNCLLVKINQAGTVNKAMKAINEARKDNWNLMISHRSGDSCDSFIADLTVGLNAGMIKAGAPARGERVAKYNRLLEIENELGKKARYSKKLL